MRHRLTDTTIRRLDAPEKGNRIYFDALLSGFGLRVTANDARSFVLQYRTRNDGRERRLTIGAIETWSTTSARDHARKLKRKIDAGKDQLGDLEKEREATTIDEMSSHFEG